MEAQYFNLIAYQEEVRQISSPKKLFELWAEICRHYDRGHISKYELDEMKSLIWPILHRLDSLRSVVNTPSV